MRWQEGLPQARIKTLLLPSPSEIQTDNIDALLFEDAPLARHHVVYDAAGATGGSVPTDSTEYARGVAGTVLGNTGGLVKSGYAFAGWSPSAS